MLLELEEADFLTSVASAKANLAQAEAAHAQEKARSEQARLNWEDLGYDEEPNELVLRLPQLREAVARVNSAETLLAQAERNLKRSKIKAPFDGVVDKIELDVGDFLNRGSTCATLLDLDPMMITGDISETELLDLTKESGVKVITNDGQVFEGQIIQRRR